jgi:2-oxoglutarate ferredoxin oxidoreductase subunit beta
MLESDAAAIHKFGLEKDEILYGFRYRLFKPTDRGMSILTLAQTHGRAITFAPASRWPSRSCMSRCDGVGGATAILQPLLSMPRAGTRFDGLYFQQFDLWYDRAVRSLRPHPRANAPAPLPMAILENNFNISGLAQAAGASFVARRQFYHATQLEKIIEKAILKKVFTRRGDHPMSEMYGRRNREDCSG